MLVEALNSPATIKRHPSRHTPHSHSHSLIMGTRAGSLGHSLNPPKVLGKHGVAPVELQNAAQRVRMAARRVLPRCWGVKAVKVDGKRKGKTTQLTTAPVR